MDAPGKDESDSASSPPSDALPVSVGDSAVTGLPATFTKFGNVGVVWRHTATSDQTSVQALFEDYGALGSECTTTTMGACIYLKCPGPDGGALVPNSDPGMVAIGTAPSQVSLMYVGSNVGDGTNASMALWPPGTSIPMASNGSSVVPAWSATVTMPSIATVTAPVLLDGGSLTIQRTGAFSVSWQGTPQLFVGLVLASRGYEQLACTLSGGQDVVPVSALALLVPGSYDLQLFTADRAYVDVGDWWIRATADALATCADGPCEVFNAAVQ